MELKKERFWAYWEGKHADPEYHHNSITPKLIEAIKDLNIGAGDMVLDHGCGQGRLSLLLGSMSKFIHIADLSEIAIDTTTKKLKATYPLVTLNSFRGDIYNYDVTQPFDAIISHRVLHTMPKLEREKCLLYFHNNLRKSCYALISARSISCNKFKWSLGKKAFQNADNSEFSFVRNKPFKFIHYFSEEALKNEIAASGLEVISLFHFTEETGNQYRNKEKNISLPAGHMQ